MIEAITFIMVTILVTLLTLCTFNTASKSKVLASKVKESQEIAARLHSYGSMGGSNLARRKNVFM